MKKCHLSNLLTIIIYAIFKIFPRIIGRTISLGWEHPPNHIEKLSHVIHRVTQPVFGEVFVIKGAKFDTLLDELDDATCPVSTWDLLFIYAKTLGLDSMRYHHLPPPGATDFNDKLFLTRGYSQEHTADFKRLHRYLKSPLERPTSQDNKHVFWPKSEVHLDFSKDQLSELKEIYFKDHFNGVIINVYGENNRNGWLIFQFKDVDRHFSKTEVRHLQWASQQAHLVFCKLQTKARGNRNDLTHREKEILKWVAHGKSNSVIADIIGISQHTVNGHLRRIYLKTGTSDRTTASLRGIGDGLIDY